MTTIPTQPELEAILTKALKKLLKKDGHLLEADANERSISHRLAIYIEAQMRTWNVDCEYNRDRHDPKVTNLKTENTTNQDGDACTVFPDIIVHRRNTDNNLLIIEMKKSSSNLSSERDHEKLKSYRLDPLSYRHALFLKVRTDRRQKEPWIMEWQQ